MDNINRRQFVNSMTVFIGMSTFAGCVPTRKKPNIVFVLADDLGWSQLGCYGSDFYQTPNIDRLARQGMRFTDAYAACPVCSPTRASIMTGKYPAKLHLTDFIPGGEPPDQSPLAHPDWKKYLPLEEVTIAEALKKQGYVTAHFGKWHLSIEKTPPESLSYNPDKQGFDESFVTFKPVPSMAKEWQTPEDDAHNVRIITEKSLEFIDKNKDKPFLLFVSHNTIHTPVMEKQALVEKYKQKPDADKPENNPILGAMIETLDKSVGKLMDKLDQLGCTDNTVFIFFSDNGGLERVADQTTLRSGKANLYEGGIRVPLIVRWPGKVPSGSTCSEIVSSIDWFPTLVSVAKSKQSYLNVDGVDLLSVLLEKQSLDRDAIYWHYPHYHSSGSGPSGAVREGDFKLIEWYENSLTNGDNAIELYNLADDLSETTNLASDMPQKANDLMNKLKTWRIKVGAQMPEITTNQD